MLYIRHSYSTPINALSNTDYPSILLTYYTIHDLFVIKLSLLYVQIKLILFY